MAVLDPGSIHFHLDQSAADDTRITSQTGHNCKQNQSSSGSLSHPQASPKHNRLSLCQGTTSSHLGTQRTLVPLLTRNGHLSLCGDSPTTSPLGLLAGTPRPQATLARNGHLSLCVGLPNHKPSWPSAGDSPASSHLGTQRTLVPLCWAPQPQALLAFCRGLPGFKPSWHATDTCPSMLGSPTSSPLGLLPGTPLPGLKPTWHATDTCSSAGAPRPETATLSTSTFHQDAAEVAARGPILPTACPTRNQRLQTCSESVRLRTLPNTNRACPGRSHHKLQLHLTHGLMPLSISVPTSLRFNSPEFSQDLLAEKCLFVPSGHERQSCAGRAYQLP